MGVFVKKIVYDIGCLPPDSVVRHTYEFNEIIEFPLVTGKIENMITEDMLKQGSLNIIAKPLKTPLLNSAGIMKNVIKVGAEGFYFLELPPNKVLDQIIITPEDVVFDIYCNEKSLLYSFYSPEKDTISITAKVIDDDKGIRNEIAANLRDIPLRQYYIKQSLSSTKEGLEKDRFVPDVMDVEKAARYLGIRKKTLYNWASNGKIKTRHAGRLLRFKKDDLDKFLEENPAARKKSRRKRK